MNKMLWIILPIALMCITSCKKFEGDVTAPSFLRLDNLRVQRQEIGAPSSDDGWYTYDIDAVQLTAYFAGDAKETILGTFELPCHVPVLHEGTAEYIRIAPVIKQNGIASTRVQYPYFHDTTITNVQLVTGETTCIGDYDTNKKEYWLPVYYHSTPDIDILAYENFEPLNTATIFDTSITGVNWIRNHTENARTGSGYLRVDNPADENSVLFPFKEACNVPDPTKLLYLEMDYHTDVHLRVGLISAYMSGANEEVQWVMTLYPNKEWQKIYINLGKLWALFNHNPNFTIIFSTLNTTGKGGSAYIDNLKVITM